jgi:hypothetical protein
MRLFGATLVLALGLALTACGGGCGCETTAPAANAPMAVGQSVSNFILPDVNPGSPSHTQPVMPAQHSGRVTAWYFSKATCGYCREQFVHLEALRDELAQSNPALNLAALGVNAVGEEGGNPVICLGRTLPWLQDAADVNAWTRWAAVWRDVFVLDANLKVVGIYNLTNNDLGVPANYAALKDLILSAAP